MMPRSCVVAAAFTLLVLAGASAEPAPLPSDWQTACSRDVMWNITTEDNTCSEGFWDFDDPVESCCATLAKYYGPNSTLPSRNCWCVPEFYAQHAEYALINYISIPTYLASCEAFGHPVYVYAMGAGPCAGDDGSASAADTPAAGADEAVVTPPPVLPMRTFSQWVSGLSQFKFGAIMFTVAILAAIGFSLMAWAFIFDACVDLYEIMTKAKKN